MSDAKRGPRQTDRLAALEAAVEARTHDLMQALEQQTALLHELDHRVKNNLQLMSSLMLLQVRREPDPVVRGALSEMQARLNAVAVVHRRLFQTDDVRTFRVDDFMRDLAAEITAATGALIDCELAPADGPASKAAPLALLINELVGGPARQCADATLAVRMADAGGGLRIEIEDCGVSSSAADTSGGFSRTIETLLARQLGAQIEREDRQGGGQRITVALEF